MYDRSEPFRTVTETLMSMRTGPTRGAVPEVVGGPVGGATDHAGPMELVINVPPAYSVDDILHANDMVQHAFVNGLHASNGATARAHLTEKRRLPDWLLAEERFGYIAPGDSPVRAAAQRHGIPLELCVEAGLLRRATYATHAAFLAQHNRTPVSSAELSEFFTAQLAERQEYYADYPPLKTVAGRWVHGDWLTIPVRTRDTAGAVRIAGFQYRSLRADSDIGKQGRYRSPLNTQALVWEDTLLGLAEERDTIAMSGDVVLVEGKFDQVSVRAAVASLPVACRPGAVALGGLRTRGASDHGETPEARAGVLGILPRAGARRVIVFLDDEDEATSAALRIAALLVPFGVEVHVAMVRDGWSRNEDSRSSEPCERPKDPGMLWERHGAEAVQTVIRTARGRDFLETAAQVIERRLMNSLQSGQTYQRLQAMDTILDLLAPLPMHDRARIIPLVARAAHLSATVVQLAMRHRLGVAIEPIAVAHHPVSTAAENTVDAVAPSVSARFARSR